MAELKVEWMASHLVEWLAERRECWMVGQKAEEMALNLALNWAELMVEQRDCSLVEWKVGK